MLLTVEDDEDEPAERPSQQWRVAATAMPRTTKPMNARVPRPTRINDFVVKFANVNGSGSASANRLFARSILRMGVPVASRNIFPSNIQGLPTWYEVRVSEAGHIGRRGGVDLMVAMNPQTWDQDVREIDPGGYLFYDSTRPMPQSKFRDDITVVGVPLTAICNARYKDPRQRQLFKNIIYVGALAELLGIETEVVEKLIGEQFKGKDKLIQPNIEALHMGRDHARAELGGKLDLVVRRADAVGDRIFIEGNNAAGLGCVYGGATVAAWYPITPSTSLAEAFGNHCRRYRVDKETGKNRFAIVQAEDELASIGMVIGAAWNGARAFTCTAGPGISLMQEFIGLAYFAEIPAVIFDVQRGGPSTGMPTRTQQSDILILRLRLAWRHQARAAAAGGSARELRVRGAILRPRRPAADADLRHARPRHRHERVAVQAADLGRQPRLRPRQGADRGGARGRPRIRPLSRRRRRRHHLPHLSRRTSEQGRLLHARHVAQPLRQVQRRGFRLRRQHGAPAPQVRHGQEPGAGADPPGCRQGNAHRRHLLRLDRTGDARGHSRRWPPTTSTSIRCACAPSRSPRPWSIS